MKKILILTLTLALTLTLLCGCDIRTFNEYVEPTLAEGETEPNYQEEQGTLTGATADYQFERITLLRGNTVANKNNFVLFRDTYTDIVYIGMRSQFEYTSLTPMLKPDGLPMLYSEWLQLKEGTATIEDLMPTEPPTEAPTEYVEYDVEEETEESYG